MGLPPLSRRLLLGSIDGLLIPLSIWLSFWLRTSEPFSQSLFNTLWLLPASWSIGLSVYAILGQYRGLSRYVSSYAFYAVAFRNAVILVAVFSLGKVLPVQAPPHSVWPLTWLILTSLTGGIRFALRDFLLRANQSSDTLRTRVVIYGAGNAGAQLAASIRVANSHNVVAFLDDSPTLWKRELDGIPIKPPYLLSELISGHHVQQVLLAIPSLSRSKRRLIIEDIQQLGIAVLQVPTLEEITQGFTRINTLRPVAIEELLGRDPVPPSPALLGPGVIGKVVCVTGAGGSIGSELCRQILKLSPSKLVLFERSEPNLYAIDQELRRMLPESIKLVLALGSSGDSSLVEHVFLEHKVQVVFHAAAYKHVPLVQANPLAGLANNVIGTLTLARASVRCGVASFTLISTDKAVRPCNVMGASKRAAELVIQALANENVSTLFSMVRFGNVLGSSGSVVPLFRQQIASGGPITLTHPEIIRYFMTIPEAALLVLQSAVLAKGGDLFILDMGEPVKIMDLAKQMVLLSGLSLRNPQNLNGDIEIVCTGLRPGEKLYEELLIDSACEHTAHPLIYRAVEHLIPASDLMPMLKSLENAIRSQDANSALDILSNFVPEWQRFN